MLTGDRIALHACFNKVWCTSLAKAKPGESERFAFMLDRTLFHFSLFVLIEHDVLRLSLSHPFSRYKPLSCLRHKQSKRTAFLLFATGMRLLSTLVLTRWSYLLFDFITNDVYGTAIHNVRLFFHPFVVHSGFLHNLTGVWVCGCVLSVYRFVPYVIHQKRKNFL